MIKRVTEYPVCIVTQASERGKRQTSYILNAYKQNTPRVKLINNSVSQHHTA